MSTHDQTTEGIPDRAGGRLRRGRLRKWPFKLFVALLVTLVSLEIGVHLIFHDFEFNALIEPDPFRWSRLRPGAEGWISLRQPSFLRSYQVYRRGYARIDERGFRSVRLPAPSRKTRLRVLCLGDSVTFGWALDDEWSYPSLLSHRLGEAMPERAVEVINAGVPGYSSRQGLIYLDRELMTPRPDLVIVEFGFNDSLPAYMRILGPMRFKPDREVMRGKPDAWETVDRGGLEWINYELSFTYLAKVLMGFMTAVRIQAPVYDADTGKIGANPLAEKNAYLWARVPPEDYRANIGEICGLCQRRGIKVILVEPWGVPDEYRRVVREVGRERGVTVVSQAEVIQRGLRDFRAILSDPRFSSQVQAIKGTSHPFPPGIFSLLLVDYLHPNEIGNTLFVDRLMQVLQNQP